MERLNCKFLIVKLSYYLWAPKVFGTRASDPPEPPSPQHCVSHYNVLSLQVIQLKLCFQAQFDFLNRMFSTKQAA